MGPTKWCYFMTSDVSSTPFLHSIPFQMLFLQRIRLVEPFSPSSGYLPLTALRSLRYVKWLKPTERFVPRILTKRNSPGIILQYNPCLHSILRMHTHRPLLQRMETLVFRVEVHLPLRKYLKVTYLLQDTAPLRSHIHTLPEKLRRRLLRWPHI